MKYGVMAGLENPLMIQGYLLTYLTGWSPLLDDEGASRRGPGQPYQGRPCLEAMNVSTAHCVRSPQLLHALDVQSLQPPWAKIDFGV